MKLKLFAALLLVASFSASAAPIAQYTFETQVQTPASVDSNATASNFTLSSGSVTFVTGNAPSAVSAISGTGWNVADGVKWWGFTITANSGFLMDLTSLTFDDRASGTGPTSWSVTVNGVAASLNQASHSAFSAGPMNTVNLSGNSFQDLSSAEVKIFGFGASGASGTWRLDNVTLDGTMTRVSSVPETLSFAFTTCFLIGFLAIAHRVIAARALSPVKIRKNPVTGKNR